MSAPTSSTSSASTTGAGEASQTAPASQQAAHFPTTLRTVTAGELSARNVGEPVVLTGWVARRRDYGKLIFIDLRDRYGVTQVVVDGERSPEAAQALQVASEVGPEWVLRVAGVVAKRLPGKENPQLATGEIEVEAQSIDVLNPSKVPPFPITDRVNADEALRLKYRYLDIRRDSILSNIVLRHRVVKFIRDFLDTRGFIEVETPILTKSTPEGARDFLVPSRLYPGEFYALPQAPQQFKQLLMVAGVDRYFQIARCFRDEDLRADRQPEFTQLDLEMSFVSEADVMGLIEALLTAMVETLTPQKRIKQKPFPHLSFAESMRRYGTDHPDTRFGLPLVELTGPDAAALVAGFKVFEDALAAGGIIKALRVPGQAIATRKELDELQVFARQYGAKGLVTLALAADGAKGPLVKALSPDQLQRIEQMVGAESGDLVLFVADDEKVANDVMFRLRVRFGERLGLIDQNEMAFVWLVDFPMFEIIEENGQQRYHATHNPFSGVRPGDEALFETNPLQATARQYDIVLNGFEVGGGSIRINIAAVQRRVFQLLGLSDEQIAEQFGHMLEAFEYGAPPHGGIALGIDRLVMLLGGGETIRDVIAFPKMQNGQDALMRAPSPVEEEQLKELHVRIREPEKAERADTPQRPAGQ